MYVCAPRTLATAKEQVPCLDGNTTDADDNEFPVPEPLPITGQVPASSGNITDPNCSVPSVSRKRNQTESERDAITGGNVLSINTPVSTFSFLDGGSGNGVTNHPVSSVPALNRGGNDPNPRPQKKQRR